MASAQQARRPGLGAGQADRRTGVFFDTTRNASRRFSGLNCQNRVKASAGRGRRAAPGE
ncbi:CGNR zinc finger domain-containing protein [Actinoplanes italicus]|uniref:CGNR zinc finger domain-containing protein n=1 Tax=Actinoplanes italicus TaxID=113567 RepID=UPI000D04F0CC